MANQFAPPQGAGRPGPSRPGGHGELNGERVPQGTYPSCPLMRALLLALPLICLYPCYARSPNDPQAIQRQLSPRAAVGALLVVRQLGA